MNNDPCSLSLQTISPGEHMVIVEPGHTWLADDLQMQSLFAWLHAEPGRYTSFYSAVVSSRVTLYFLSVDAQRVDLLLHTYGAAPQ